MAFNITPVGWVDGVSVASMATLGQSDSLIKAMQLDAGASRTSTYGTVDADTVTGYAPTVGWPGSVAFRNKLYNGDFSIDQRNAGSAVTLSTSARKYGPDRWSAYSGGASTATMQRVAGTMSGSAYGVTMTGNTSVSAVSVGQIVESSVAYPLSGQTVTVSFWAKANTSKSVIMYAYVPTVADTWVPADFSTGAAQIASNSFTFTTTATQYSYSFTATNAIRGMAIVFVSSSMSTNAQTFTLEQVQLEVGASATVFETRPPGLELSLCQRYYINMSATATLKIFGQARTTSATSARVAVPLPVSMRTAPTPSLDAGTFQVTYGGTAYPASAVTVGSDNVPNLAAFTTTISGAPTSANVGVFENTTQPATLGLSADF